MSSLPTMQDKVEAVAQWLLADSPEAVLRMCEVRRDRSLVWPIALGEELPDIARRAIPSVREEFQSFCVAYVLSNVPWTCVARRLGELFTNDDEARMRAEDREDVEDRIATVERESLEPVGV